VGERFVSAIKRNAGLVNRARPSQYDAEHGQTDSSAAFSKSRDPPGGHSPGRAGKRHVATADAGRPGLAIHRGHFPGREASRRRRTSRRRLAVERHGTAGHRGAGLAIHRGHSPGRAGKPHVAAARDRRPPGSRPRNPPRSLSPGRVTSPPHEPTPAGRGALRHCRPPHSSMRSAIPLMSDTLRRRHLTRRRSVSRPEAAGSSAARSSRQGDKKRRFAWCGISRWREKTLFRRYL